MNINFSRLFRYTEPNSTKIKKMPMRRPMFMVQTSVDKILRSGGYWFAKMDIGFGLPSSSLYASVKSGDYDNWELGYNVSFPLPTGSQYASVKSGDYDNWELGYNVNFGVPMSLYSTVSGNSTIGVTYNIDMPIIPLSTYKAEFIHSDPEELIDLEYTVGFNSMNEMMLSSAAGEQLTELSYSVDFGDINGVMLSSISKIDKRYYNNYTSPLDIFNDSSTVRMFPLKSNATPLVGNAMTTVQGVTFNGQSAVFNGENAFMVDTYTNDTMTVALKFTLDPNALDSTYHPLVEINGIVLSVITYYGAFLILGKNQTSDIGLAIEKGREYSVVFSYKLSTNEKKLWVNGTEVTSNRRLSMNTVLGKLSFGRESAYSVYYFKGLMSKIRILDRIVNDSEVALLTNDTLESEPVDEYNVNYGIEFRDIDTSLLGNLTTQKGPVIQQWTADILDIFGDNSCLALYTFNDTTVDISGTYTGASEGVTYTDGTYDKCGVFDGINSYVGPVTFTTPNEYSASLFFEVSDTSGWKHILSVGTGSLILYNNILYYGWYGESMLNVPILANTKYHVLITHNKISNTREMWVNGTKIVPNGGSASYFTDSNVISIGKSVAYPSNYRFKGKIEQVRVFSKLLNESHIPHLTNEFGYVINPFDAYMNYNLYFGEIVLTSTKGVRWTSGANCNNAEVQGEYIYTYSPYRKLNKEGILINRETYFDSNVDILTRNTLSDGSVVCAGLDPATNYLIFFKYNPTTKAYLWKKKLAIYCQSIYCKVDSNNDIYYVFSDNNPTLRYLKITSSGSISFNKKVSTPGGYYFSSMNDDMSVILSGGNSTYNNVYKISSSGTLISGVTLSTSYATWVLASQEYNGDLYIISSVLYDSFYLSKILSNGTVAYTKKLHSYKNLNNGNTSIKIKDEYLYFITTYDDYYSVLSKMSLDGTPVYSKKLWYTTFERGITGTEGYQSVFCKLLEVYDNSIIVFYDNRDSNSNNKLRSYSIDQVSDFPLPIDVTPVTVTSSSISFTNDTTSLVNYTYTPDTINQYTLDSGYIVSTQLYDYLHVTQSAPYIKTITWEGDKLLDGVGNVKATITDPTNKYAIEKHITGMSFINFKDPYINSGFSIPSFSDAGSFSVVLNMRCIYSTWNYWCPLLTGTSTSLKIYPNNSMKFDFTLGSKNLLTSAISIDRAYEWNQLGIHSSNGTDLYITFNGVEIGRTTKTTSETVNFNTILSTSADYIDLGTIYFSYETFTSAQLEEMRKEDLGF